MATYTPGRDPIPLPDGVSMPWKPGADFVLNLHLHPTGKPEVEQSSIGFYLTDEAPRRSMVDLLLIDMRIDIPAGERAYRTRAELTVRTDVEAVGIFPHMHMIGRAFKLTAYPPKGEPFPLLSIEDWDFNWQTYYQYTKPMKLARDAGRHGGDTRQLGRQRPQPEPAAEAGEVGRADHGRNGPGLPSGHARSRGRLREARCQAWGQVGRHPGRGSQDGGNGTLITPLSRNRRKRGWAKRG
jgi:hypothetical protein